MNKITDFEYLQLQVKLYNEWYEETETEEEEDAVLEELLIREERLIEEGKRVLKGISEEGYNALVELTSNLKYRDKAIESLLKLSL